jgi:phosphatidylserine/phosphatidylglycerophosphate/cardiolipin synthase-like enzyme
MEICDCCCTCFDGGYESSGDECEDKSAGSLSHVGKAAYEVLRTKHNNHHHLNWNVTSGVIVGELHQTPRLGWLNEGDYPNEKVHDEWFPKRIAEIISKTETWCDVMSLSPPDGMFMDTMKEAIKTVAENAAGKDAPVTIRLMFGNIIGMPVNCNKLIKKLVSLVPKENLNIRVWVGAWRRGVSWNHAKIVAVDGKYLWTGGHNMWDYHYLRHNPVYDLSLEMKGRCAHDGHRFANQQWAFIEYKQATLCGQFVDKLPDGMPLVAKTRVTISEFPNGCGEFAPQYKKSLVPMYEPLDGEVPMITMGRNGTLDRFARPSDDAFLAMFGAAKRIMRLAVQDLGPVCIPGTKLALPGCMWPHHYLDVFARVMWERGVDIEIALSNPGSIPGGLGAAEACYGNGWSCIDVAAEIIKSIRKQFPQAKDDELRQKVEKNLRVCFIRNSSGNRFQDGHTLGMHAKHFIIDDVATYIGSQNLYTCDLAEWGVVIDNAEATKKLMEEYWEPMWKASYTQEDCNVQKVMDGLDISRDGETAILLTKEKRQQLRDARRRESNVCLRPEDEVMESHGPIRGPFAE